MSNHYFYDHQGDIVGQLLNTDLRIQKGDSVLLTEDSPAVYLVQATLHIQGETKPPDTYNWLVNRMTKLVVNMSNIDTTAPRQPLPLKSIQAYQNK
ncbi:MAG: hypothetical protein IM613_12490 [Cytophagales bacterium]|jgi:hypothetical protein|nr:hypothetical protein [Cytophagales bacterium]